MQIKYFCFYYDIERHKYSKLKDVVVKRVKKSPPVRDDKFNQSCQHQDQLNEFCPKFLDSVHVVRAHLSPAALPASEIIGRASPKSM